MPSVIARRRPWLTGFWGLFTALLIVLGAYQAYVGAPLLVYRGGLWFISMRDDAPWLSRSVRLALATPEPVATPGQVAWRRIAPGLEIGELPVLVGDEEVDRLYLTRIDPEFYQFDLRVDPDNDLNAWMRELQAVAVINGSYYDDRFGPATPVRIDGAAAGPHQYDATHGAFVSSPEQTQLVDLASADWNASIAGAHTAIVSYPTLLDESGANRAPQSRWLASRSFLAQDAEGLIILGSAPEGFFSLYRLGEFLRISPLRLSYVLNLDGGPVACHGVSAGGVTRLIYGHIELQSDGEGTPLRVLPSSRSFRSLMPIVLAVFPREPEER